MVITFFTIICIIICAFAVYYSYITYRDAARVKEKARKDSDKNEED